MTSYSDNAYDVTIFLVVLKSSWPILYSYHLKSSWPILYSYFFAPLHYRVCPDLIQNRVKFVNQRDCVWRETLNVENNLFGFLKYQKTSILSTQIFTPPKLSKFSTIFWDIWYIYIYIYTNPNNMVGPMTASIFIVLLGEYHQHCSSKVFAFPCVPL